MANLIIRKENKSDYNEVFNLVKTAFETAEISDGDEHYLVQRLKESPFFIPELSLVAEAKNKIIGYILFTKLKTGASFQLALAPLAVDLNERSKGTGAKLITEGHKIAKGLGYNYSVVLGNPLYYERFGYVQSDTFGIKNPFGIEQKYFMAAKLNKNAEKFNGIIPEYPKEFFGGNTEI